MKDAGLLFLFICAGFPLGAALALFILGMDKHRRLPRQPPATAITGGIAVCGVGGNLGLALLSAVQHEWNGMQNHLIVTAVFVSATWGALLVTRRVQSERPEKPGEGDDV